MESIDYKSILDDMGLIKSLRSVIESMSEKDSDMDKKVAELQAVQGKVSGEATTAVPNSFVEGLKARESKRARASTKPKGKHKQGKAQERDIDDGREIG